MDEGPSREGDRRAAHRRGHRGAPLGAARPRARLSVARAQHADAVAGRAAASASGDAGPLEPVRRRLRAGRAVGRPASGRYRGAAHGARPVEGLGQLAVRRRARSRRDAARGLDRRRRARRGRARRAGPLQRPARGARACRGIEDAALPVSAAHAPPTRSPRTPEGLAAAGRRDAQQPARPRRGLPAGRVHDRDRRLGLGQVEPGEPGAGRAGRANISGTTLPDDEDEGGRAGARRRR